MVFLDTYALKIVLVIKTAVNILIRIPQKSQGITYKKYLIDEKTKEIESFSVYPPNRRPQVLPDILESPIK